MLYMNMVEVRFTLALLIALEMRLACSRVLIPPLGIIVHILVMLESSVEVCILKKIESVLKENYHTAANSIKMFYQSSIPHSRRL